MSVKFLAEALLKSLTLSIIFTLSSVRRFCYFLFARGSLSANLRIALRLGPPGRFGAKSLHLRKVFKSTAILFVIFWIRTETSMLSSSVVAIFSVKLT